MGGEVAVPARADRIGPRELQYSFDVLFAEEQRHLLVRFECDSKGAANAARM